MTGGDYRGQVSGYRGLNGRTTATKWASNYDQTGVMNIHVERNATKRASMQ
jgi:hypothetical protein